MMKSMSVLIVATVIVPHFARAADNDVVLDTSGFWRVHCTLRTPVFRDAGGLREFGSACNTEFPSSAWKDVGFDDSSWVRKPGVPFQSWSHWQQAIQANVGFINGNKSSPAIALLCLRGKFQVKDLAAASDLLLDLEYRGGVVVYLNGKEVARGHLANSGVGFATVAEDYARDACLDEAGRLFNYRKHSKSPAILKRIRKLVGVTVPRNLLREGTNVLAVELHRAAYSKEVQQQMVGLENHEYIYASVDTCGLTSIRLRGGSTAVSSAVTRPEGLQAWNSDVLASDFDVDYGDPCEPLCPLELVGARNGAFSAKVVLGSRHPIKGLETNVTDLTSATGRSRIPASAVSVRYGLPDGTERAAADHYFAPPDRFDSLNDSAPAQVAVRSKKITSLTRVLAGQPEPVYGAVVPVWVTIDVPADAMGGDYAGMVTIKAEAAKAIEVAVKLKVCEYTLPDPKDFRTFVELVESPDSLAIKYGVPLWSDRHFALLANAFKQLGRIGNRAVYVPLICHTNLGNEQTMVRWIGQQDGSYAYDLSIVERYLDIAMENMGQPDIVCFGVWDVFLEGGRFTGRGIEVEGPTVQAARSKVRGKGPLVSLLDPVSGKVTPLQLPQLSDPASKALWGPLMRELRELMNRRGLERSMMLGMPTDARPTPQIVSLFRECVPDVKWVCHGHSYPKDLHGVDWGYTTSVWWPRYIEFPGTSKYGWRKPDLKGVQFARNVRDSYPQATFRLIGEMNIAGQQRGFGWFGADFWPVFEGRRSSARVYERYPQANWRNLNIMTALLGPGPHGPVSTHRFEMMIEGVQECEARIFVEKALLEKRISGPLAEHCARLLEERNRATLMGLGNHMLEGWLKDDSYARIHGWWNEPGLAGGYWYLTSGWQDRSEKLYAAAASVEKVLGQASSFRNTVWRIPPLR
ncbi:MAG: hypothetical protein H8E44_10765 [Planctomycetes bacterium]|nr:hypothetical protein [Planctomycetota bacterium]